MSNYRSSEEEITVNTGIEKGFESWADRESGEDDETIDEKGVDSSEEIDFNVVPIMHEEEIGNFDEFDKNIQVTMKGGHNHQWTWCSVLSYFRI